MASPLRVALDATPLLGARTGVGTFVSGLLAALAARPDLDVRTFALTVRPAPHRIPLPPRLLHQLWSRADWPPLPGVRADVLHGTNFVVPPAGRRTGGRARVVTVHDLTTLRFPHLATPATRPFPHLVRRALRAGAWVHTPSSFVAAEVVDLLGADPSRVRAIPHGLSPSGAVITDSKHVFQFRYILALGTIEPRKDLPTLVRAFDALAATDPELRLVVAGPPGWGAGEFDAACDRAAARDRIVRMGWVNDDQRAALLGQAAVFAYPSLYEGFGLPPLEAMAAAVPVVASRAGALPEVLGDAALLVDPGDADALAQALAEVLTDEARRAGLIERGRRQAAARRWEDTAAAMADLYRDAAAA